MTTSTYVLSSQLEMERINKKKKLKKSIVYVGDEISWIIIVVEICIFMELLCDADHPDASHFIVIITIITAHAFYPAIMASHQQNKQLCQRNGII